MNERGVYLNPNRGRQLLRFDGMQFGTITPTDTDGVIDYHNHLWIWYEAKMTGKDVPRGQRLLLERLIGDAKAAKKHGIAMIVEHDIRDTGLDVFLKDCTVRELITTDDLRWRPPKYRINAIQISNLFINFYEGTEEYQWIAR